LLKKQLFLLGILIYVCSSPAQEVKCILDSAKNGENVEIYAELFPSGHDVTIRPKACPEKAVVLIYGDHPSLGKSALPMKRDEAFSQFEKYEREEQPDLPNSVCLHCPKYKITANFEGVLEVAPFAGYKKNKNGKIIGWEGFGSPRPFTQFRLLLTGVSNVEAVVRERMQIPQDEKKK
jgi:hypothetical protein